LALLAPEVPLPALADILDQWIGELTALRAKPLTDYGHLVVQWPHNQDLCSLYLGEDGLLSLLSATLAQKVEVENISNIPGWGRTLTSEKILMGFLESYAALYCTSFQLHAGQDSRAAGLV
jgi:hypothetical protein